MSSLKQVQNERHSCTLLTCGIHDTTRCITRIVWYNDTLLIKLLIMRSLSVILVLLVSVGTVQSQVYCCEAFGYIQDNHKNSYWGSFKQDMTMIEVTNRDRCSESRLFPITVLDIKRRKKNTKIEIVIHSDDFDCCTYLIKISNYTYDRFYLN
jgi:hypothetical protein